LQVWAPLINLNVADSLPSFKPGPWACCSEEFNFFLKDLDSDSEFSVFSISNTSAGKHDEREKENPEPATTPNPLVYSHHISNYQTYNVLN
jgi:hypothetical protein